MLREIVHVTSLSMYNSCPYSFSQAWWPLDPKLTFKGDMLNIMVNSQGWYDEFVERYGKNIVYDFKDMENMKIIFANAREKIAEIKSKYKRVYQEAKFLHKYNDEYYVVWTPDLIFYDEDRDLWCIRDRKYSTHNWYLNPDVTKNDMQKIAYPVFVCEMFGVDKVEFSFSVFDKNNGKFGEAPEIVEYEHAKKVLHRVMKDYIESTERGEYPPKENNKCKGMCDIKKCGKCPLFKTTVSISSSDDDFL